MSEFMRESYEGAQHAHVAFLSTITLPQLSVSINHNVKCCIVAEHVTLKHYVQIGDVQTLVGTYCEVPEGFSFEGDNVVHVSVRSENYYAIMETLHEVTVVTKP